MGQIKNIKLHIVTDIKDTHLKRQASQWVNLVVSELLENSELFVANRDGTILVTRKPIWEQLSKPILLEELLMLMELCWKKSVWKLNSPILLSESAFVSSSSKMVKRSQHSYQMTVV